MNYLESLALRFEYQPSSSTLQTSSPKVALWILDQSLLPLKEEWILLSSVNQTIEAIQQLKVRGAPLIGVVAALSLATSAAQGASHEQLNREAQALEAARPTAVNLMNCMNRMKKALAEKASSEQLVLLAQELFREDEHLCEKIAEQGADLLQSGDSILTHCNTGGLATAGIGTALGIFRKAKEQGKIIHVYVDETRPLLQGGRLTTWELKKLGIPYTLITDSMAGFLMAAKKVQKIIVGCDRIASNGDFANKIGTYSLSVLAHYHNVPFYVAGPYTTLDWECSSGDKIPIEQRAPEEVLGAQGFFGKIQWAAEGSSVYNPSFDVTPAHLVTGWILNFGVFNKDDFAQGRVKSCMQSSVGLVSRNLKGSKS